MEDHPSRDYVRRMARAEELTALAAHAPNPAARVRYLQYAAAFRRLAELEAARGGGLPPQHPGG